MTRSTKEQWEGGNDLGALLNAQQPIRKILVENGLKEWPAKLITDIASLLDQQKREMVEELEDFRKHVEWGILKDLAQYDVFEKQFKHLITKIKGNE